ncbi:MAG: T9SS type A sorting domain-containing protein [Bacteroidota bacterium]|nr:T9SS type A sorting domain-containing protein [Bacteroidota bacterium]
MNKLITVIFCLFIFNNSYSQCRLDSIVYYSPNDQSVNIPVDKTYYTYNNKKQLETESSFYYSDFDSAWQLSYFLIYKYNNNNKVSIIYDLADLNNKLDTFSKTVYYHNTKGLDSLRKFYLLNQSTSELEINSQYISYYNNQNQIIEELRKNYESSTQTWEDYYKINLFYQNNKQVLSINYKWNDATNDWLYDQKYSNFYLNNIKIDSSFNWSTSENTWKLNSHSISYYNSKNQDTLVRSFSLNGQINFEVRKNFDVNGCLKTDTTYNRDFIYRGYRHYYYQDFSSNIVSQSTNSYIVYPNPVHSEISISNYFGCYSIIEITTGKELKKGNIVSANETIDISKLISGVYLLKLNNKIQKIIKY